jgi:hypothetical protein
MVREQIRMPETTEKVLLMLKGAAGFSRPLLDAVSGYLQGRRH